MEERHRDAIRKTYAMLVKDCDIDSLLPVLVQKNVFSSEMIMKYMNPLENSLTRKRDLFLDVQRRGPNAFPNLIVALRETGQNYLANMLDPSQLYGVNKTVANVQPKKHTHPFILPECESAENLRNILNNVPDAAIINLNCEPLKICVKAATRLYDDPTQNDVGVYSTHSKNRGAVLVINNIHYINDVYEKREGAETDGKNLHELFRQMSFTVEMHVDLTGEEMESAIYKFRTSSKIIGVDMVFVILMGHGFLKSDDVTHLIGINNKSVSTTWIEEQFDNAHCKPLQKRPKIIMYQTCRGHSPDMGVVAHKTQTDSGAVGSILRTQEDMLIAHSTVPGYASHRDTFLGTWFIHSFCEIMMEYACTKHLEEIFKLVDSHLALLRSCERGMQTSMFVNLAFKNCYVHPKIYMEDGLIKNL